VKEEQGIGIRRPVQEDGEVDAVDGHDEIVGRQRIAGPTGLSSVRGDLS
jgi:hypothetical protein